MFLTTEIANLIVSLVRSGAYPHVAAAAAGVPRREFRRWMRLGREEDADDLYRSLVQRVFQAAGQCRALAETSIRDNGPLNWLKYGLGRERPNLPGWTTTAKPATARPKTTSRGFPVDPVLVSGLLEALAPFPEAQAAASALLAAFSKTLGKHGHKPLQ